METTKNLNAIILLIVLALFAAACGSQSDDLDDLTAVASSNAQPTATATPVATDGFCSAYGDGSQLVGLDPTSDELVAGLVAGIDALPDDAPNVLIDQRNAINLIVDRAGEADSVDGIFEAEPEDTEAVAAFVIFKTFDTEMASAYIASVCPDFKVDAEVAALTPDLPAHNYDFCAALSDLREPFEATMLGLDGNDARSLAAMTGPARAVERARPAAAPLSAVASLSVLRAFASTVHKAAGPGNAEAAFNPEMGALMVTVAERIGPDAAAWLDLECPEVQAGRWLGLAQRGGTDQVGVSDEIDGVRSETNTVSLLPIAHTFEVGALRITISGGSFTRSHQVGTARDTDQLGIELYLSFDRGHELAPGDLAIISPDGLRHGAIDQPIPLDEGTVAFAVDREPLTLVGWKLEVTHLGETVATDI